MPLSRTRRLDVPLKEKQIGNVLFRRESTLSNEKLGFLLFSRAGDSMRVFLLIQPLTWRWEDLVCWRIRGEPHPVIRLLAAKKNSRVN